MNVPQPAMSLGSTVPEKPTHERWKLVSILFVTLFVAYIDRVNVSVLSADNVFLTEMGIKGQGTQIGLLMTAFLIAYGVSNFVLSPLGDYLGPRKAMSISIALWGMSLIIGGLAPTFTLLIVSRVLLGAGEGMHYPMQSTFIKSWFPPLERGKANATWLVGQSIAPAVAMPLFTWIVYAFGWRPSFFIMAVIGLVPLALLWFCTTDTPARHRAINKAELDHIEAGLRQEADDEARRNLRDSSVADNIKSVARNYRFWLLVLYYVVNCSIWWGVMTWLPSYLKNARGFSWAAMGAMASLPYVLAIAAKIAAGYLTDKVGRRAPFPFIAMLGAAAGIYLGAVATDNVTAAIFLSLGIGAINFGTPAAWSLLQDLVPSKAVSAGAGVMNGVGNGLSSLSPLIIGSLIDSTGQYGSGLLFLVAIALVGALSCLILMLQKY